MTEIVETLDISRSPQDVFSYVNDSCVFPRWQCDVVSVRRLDPDPVTVGSKPTVIRRLGHRELPGDEEIIEMRRPATSTVRATRGLVTTIARGTIEPLEGGERSLVTIALTFEGMGSGRLLPLILRQARKQPPRNTQKLKEVLDPCQKSCEEVRRGNHRQVGRVPANPLRRVLARHRERSRRVGIGRGVGPPPNRLRPRHIRAS